MHALKSTTEGNRLVGKKREMTTEASIEDQAKFDSGMADVRKDSSSTNWLEKIAVLLTRSRSECGESSSPDRSASFSPYRTFACTLRAFAFAFGSVTPRGIGAALHLGPYLVMSAAIRLK